MQTTLEFPETQTNAYIVWVCYSKVFDKTTSRELRNDCTITDTQTYRVKLHLGCEITKNELATWN